MKKLTPKKVRDYMSYRSSEGLKHCPDCIAAACNDMAEDNYSTKFTKAPDALDYMRLLFFNDPIPQLHTHSYGFHTATGRSIIKTLKNKYYEYRTNITTA